jgi:hypothetical protein
MTETNSYEYSGNDFQIKDYFMSNKVYDFLKFLVQIALPAFGTLYFTLASIWGLPAAEQVVGTIVALSTFFGVVLQLSKKSYNSSEGQYDGSINIQEREDGVKVYSLNLNQDTSVLDSKKNVKFKVDGA